MLKSMSVRATLVALAWALSFSAHALADTARQVTIPAGDLRQGLLQLSKEYGVELVYEPELVREYRTGGVKGNYTAPDAVRLLLKGTPLELRTDPSGAMLIAPPRVNANSAAEDTPPADAAKEGKNNSSRDFRLAQVDQASAGSQVTEKSSEESNGALEEVVVTGTHIRGVQPSSPILVLTQQQMIEAGQANLGEAIRSLPQNFSGGQNPGVVQGAGGPISNQDINGASSLNLRGLGPDATLTLLNGRRLSYGSFTQEIDISQIPLAAVDQVQVLLDGASAIYGSDAVAGVANVVLKRDFDGVTANARYGEATQGGYQQQQYSVVGGTTWKSGGFIAAYNYSRNTDVNSIQRDYTQDLPPPNDLYPALAQSSIIFSGHQDLASFAHLALDALFNRRTDDGSINFYPIEIDKSHSKDNAYAVSPTVAFDLAGSWRIEVSGVVSLDHTTANQSFYSESNALLSANPMCYCDSMHSAELDANGPLFSLPAGKVRSAIGVGYRENEFNPVDDQFFSSRDRYGFLEADIPVVSSDQHVPGVSRLDVNVAVRHEDYNTFGGETTPKAGLTFSPTKDADLKFSWGRSFKVPTLLQEFQSRSAFLYPGALFGVSPTSTILFAGGGNPDLGPERATTIAAGLVLHPVLLQGFRAEANYFHISYTNRVTTPFSNFAQYTAAIDQIAPYGQFAIVNPTVAQQNTLLAAVGSQFFNFSGGPYDPSAVAALLNNDYLNVSAQSYHGVDLSLAYTSEVGGGVLAENGTVSWLKGTQETVPGAPPVDVTGTAFNAPTWRARAGINWQSPTLGFGGYINYVGGETNDTIIPSVHVGSQTTVDLTASYKFANVSGALRDFDIIFSVTNLFDAAPPYLLPVASYIVPYDQTNYSSLGRVVAVAMSKHW